MSRYLRLAAISFVAILAFGISAAAQQQSSTDNSTPTGQAKGTPPLGSFGGSDFDKVNLFNGNVSMQFPLSMSGGRAGMGAGATLSYNSKFWRMVTDRPNPQNSYNVPTYDEWDNGTFIAPGWRINTGRLVARHSGWNPSSGNCGSEPAGNQETLTRITFIAPDGTEYEFRDTLDDANPANDGQPSLLGPANCGTLQAYNRKSVWITYDGSAATFVSSADIWDISLIPGGGDPPFQTYPSGDVYLRDGTSFRVTNGRVDWMQDRNGNRVSYTYYSGSPNGGFLHTITDTLGRVTEFSYNIVDPDDVTGQTNLLVRVVQHRDPSDPDDDQVWKVVRLKLKNALRQDYVTDADPTYEELWPGTLTGPFNENMPSAVVLPTGHSWKFLYNRYGEVASVETPAHGKIEFDVVAGAGNTPTGPSPFVFRYLKERRTYVRAVDASPEGKTSYDDPSVGYPAVGTPPAETVVDVIRYIGTTSIINRSRHFFYSHPLTGVRSPRSDGYTRWQEGLEFKTEEAGSVGSTWVNRSRSHATWRQASPVGWIPSATTETENQPASNPRVIDKTTTILENGLDLVSKVDYVFDTTPYNNVTQERVFDWGAGAPSSTVLRQVNRTFEKSATYTSATIANVVHSRSLVLTESVGTGGAAESMTTNVYDGESIETCIGLSTATHNPAFNSSRVIRGNMTSVTLDPKDGSPLSTTRMRYDEAGNAIRVISANSLAPGAVEAAFTTQIDFYDPLDPLHAFPRATTRTVSKASGGPATVLSTSAIFNRWSGLITSATGYNPGETTTYSYDNFDRIQSITPPAGVGVTMVVYSAPAADLSVQSTSETIGTGSSNSSTTIVTYDGLFRAVKQQATDPNGTGLVTVDTKYDGLGRPTLVSNPYRTTGAAPTHGWTRTRYDDQNRVVLVSFFDNGPLSPPGDFETSDTGDIATVHNAGGFTVPTVTVTEQAGKQRRSGSDALGRMLWVREDPNGLNYLTTYGYDGRGNLLSVNQGGQSRTFVYDGLGRLKSAKMPECVNSSGVQVATTYTYDRESNLVTKTDPRNVTTWFSYDEMNRLRTKNFSNTAVNDVSYFYDDSGHGPAIEIPDSSGLMPGSPFDRGFSLGRLVGVVTNATASNETEQVRTGVFYGYDVAGRVTHYDQLLESTHYQNPSVPTYNRASEIVNQSYPSGSTVTNTYNVAGSLTSVAANLGGASAGSTNATYTPSGSLEEQRLSTTTALFHKIGYNSRLQPVQISLGVSSGASDKLGLSYQYGNLNTVDPGSQPDQTRKQREPGADHGLARFRADFVRTILSVRRAQPARARDGVLRLRWRRRIVHGRAGSAVGYCGFGKRA
ncbi:MAG: hypothetical protein IPF82_03065 [Blastocatellia bacterium]|nr:hypothetical protein [Blastocatellia bacterium]